MTKSDVRVWGAAAVLAALALSHAVPAEAQRRTDRNRGWERAPHVYRGDSRASYLSVGWQRIDVDGLNGALTDAGYPAFDENALTVGAGTYTTRRGLLIGVEGHGFLVPSETTDNDEFRTRYGGGYGVLKLGTAAPATGNVVIVPAVGIGAGATTLSIQERSSPSFEEVLDDPRRGVRMTQGGLVLDASVGLEYRFRPSRPGRGGMLLGVTAGYTATPALGDWKIEEGNDVSGGPDAGIEGFYLRGSLGGWSPRGRR